MNELRLDFLFDFSVSFIIIYSIGALALGRSGLWVVGHAAFLGSGGVYAWSVQDFGLISGVLVTVLICISWIAIVSFAAAYLAGDRFIMVTLAASYATFMLFLGHFGEGVRNLPGASNLPARALLVILMLIVAALLGLYAIGLEKSFLNTSLLIARDQPWVLSSSRFPVKFLVFWMHFISAIPVCVAGIASALFYRSYSPNAHGISASLLFFIVGIPFGMQSFRGGFVAALFLVTLHRFIDFLLSSSFADYLYGRLSGSFTSSASNLSAPLAEALLAVLMIYFVKIRPQGIFGSSSRWIRK